MSILASRIISYMTRKLKKDIVPGLAIPSNQPAGTSTANSRLSIQSFRIQALLLVLIAVIFYCNTFSHESAFDDRMAITDNEYVQQGTAGIKDILTSDAYQSYLEQKNGSNQLAGGRYRPLSLITFAIEQQIMGVSDSHEQPDEHEKRVAAEMSVRHIVNVLLYALSLIALLIFFRKVVFPDNNVAALLSALIFAIHPIHTEVVANVKSRDEILSMLFIALTFIKSFSYRATHKTSDLVLACLCFFLALLSKEYAAMLLILLPLSFYIIRKDPAATSIRAVPVMLIPLGLYLALRLSSVSAAAAGAENNIMNNPYLYANGLQKAATILLVLLDYLRLLVFPDVLIADYSYNQIPYTNFTNPLVWLSIAVYAGLIISMVAWLRKRHILCFAIAFYLVNLLLISNILFNIGAPMGERLIYHSSVGFAIAAGWLLQRGFAKLNIATISRFGLAGFMVILIVVSGFKTIDRNRDWKNDFTLSMADVAKAPNSVLLNNNAAAACMAKAKENVKDEQARSIWLVKATGYFDKALLINPKHDLARLNRGLCYYNTGQPEKALADWDSVRKSEPQYENLQKYLSIVSRYFFSKGMSYRAENKSDSAIIAFTESADAVPTAHEPWFELGKTLYAAGRYQEALSALNRSVSLAPNDQDAMNLITQINAMPGMHVKPE